MPRPRQPDRVIGVYGKRVVYVVDGERLSTSFASKSAAEEEAARKRKELAPAAARTLGASLAEYLTHKTACLQKDTHAATRYLIRLFLPETLDADLLASFTKARCTSLYAKLADPDSRLCAIATHHAALAKTKEFFAWCVEARWLAASPLSHQKPVGTAHRGKEQLHEDEARRWLQTALAYLEAGEMRALAPVMALLLGVRVSELLRRQVRDLDRDASILWIKSGKTKNAKRRIEVPAVLRPYCLAAILGKDGEAAIFPQTLNVSVLRWVGYICRAAGVPRVVTHSFRGLHATLAREAGHTGHAVAAQLGHGGVQMQERHYLAEGTTDRVARATILTVVGAERNDLKRSAPPQVRGIRTRKATL